jgi:hypothetical protein
LTEKGKKELYGIIEESTLRTTKKKKLWEIMTFSYNNI